ncbi:MAG: ABC transporter permease [Pseudomonadota bacterium]|nr:ABC transporter permease [Pseudomonadota bacterium]
MLNYLFKRIFYAFPILVSVNVLTFFLFFVVNTPDDMARLHLGNKHVTQEAIDSWKADRGYNKPLFWASNATGMKKITGTIFFENSLKLFLFQFGQSDSGRDISYDISQRMWPSLAIAVPILIIGVCITLTIALFVAFFRATYIDSTGVLICVIMMSISGLFYIIGGQYLIGKMLKLVPISGYSGGISSVKFLLLPVAVGVISGLGNGTRWYRTIFLEEVNKDYVRTARSKGFKESYIMFSHVLRNALIPIMTGVVVVLPSLFLGSLITESFFGIPGLGSYTIEAIRAQDFAIVRSMVFLGSLLYILGLILTDISYTLVDPRVRLN